MRPLKCIFGLSGQPHLGIILALYINNMQCTKLSKLRPSPRCQRSKLRGNLYT